MTLTSHHPVGAARRVQPTGLDRAASYLKGIVDHQLSTHKAKGMTRDAVLALKREMATNAGRTRSFDITPRFLTGMHTNAIIFQGELYAQKLGTTFPATESWYHCGMAPVALPA